ncbi:TPA: hypothetical protein N0F65_007669 [Lagenidium giganteum]|uniref:Uncharacterized protein n=1 Tax=Lagenidium giganteum TaxID=4803 RepID=A0AAV2Z8B7_9STRA|nr:TPA: hypothetical protein N0F65_007669 [Lagenidium giganteum]
MASVNAYASSLRNDRGAQEKPIEEGVPFFVPQLAKVKTAAMCQTKNKHLLFCYEQAANASGVSPSATSPTSSYRKQGDSELYTEENLRKRQLLLEDKQLRAAIARFWDTFPAVRQGFQTIEQKDYVDVFVKFYKALVAPSEFSNGEARKIVERDWERDVGDAELMTKPMFHRALFEVVSGSSMTSMLALLVALPWFVTMWAVAVLIQADIWTTGIGADIYVAFLSKLFDRVTMTVYDQEKSVWLTVFAELDKIRSMSDTTNQDQESGGHSMRGNAAFGIGSSSGGGGGGSVQKPKPPLLKKRMLSTESILSSSSRSERSLGGSSRALNGRGGGSVRRLPDVQTTTGASMATEVLRAVQAAKSKSPTAAAAGVLVSGVTSSRSDAAGNPSSLNSATSSRPDGLEFSTNDGSTDELMVSSSRSPVPAPRESPLRVQRMSSLRGDFSSSLTDRRRNTDNFGITTGSEDKPARSTGTGSESPTHQIRLAMPSIYLSPDLSHSPQATERAARRRIRESVKLAQRLRRITF